MNKSLLVFILIAIAPVAGCGGDADTASPEETADAAAETSADPAAGTGESPNKADVLPTDTNFTIPFEQLWQPWVGDLPGMTKDEALRVLRPGIPVLL